MRPPFLVEAILFVGVFTKLGSSTYQGAVVLAKLESFYPMKKTQCTLIQWLLSPPISR